MGLASSLYLLVPLFSQVLLTQESFDWDIAGENLTGIIL